MSAGPILTTGSAGAAETGNDHLTAVLVLGHDGHPAAQAALRCALGLARRMNAEIHVLHSITLEDYGIDPDLEAFDQDCVRSLAAERRQVASALADSSVTWSYHEKRGDPATQLARYAADSNAAMIIVGATHRHLIPHLAGGGNSVAKRLLHCQDRPVLVVPA
jgi:nucleotide-binding universal stress UspA family protein